MSKKIDEKLMKIGEKAFWDEFRQEEQKESRHVIVDTGTGEVVVSNARLKKSKKKIEV